MSESKNNVTAISVKKDQQEQVAQMAQSTATGVYDRYNRELHAGDYVVLNIPLPPTANFQVVDTVPNLAPNAPPGTYLIKLLLPFNLIVGKGRPVGEITRVLSLAEQVAVVPPAPPSAIKLTDTE